MAQSVQKRLGVSTQRLSRRQKICPPDVQANPLGRPEAAPLVRGVSRTSAGHGAASLGAVLGHLSLPFALPVRPSPPPRRRLTRGNVRRAQTPPPPTSAAEPRLMQSGGGSSATPPPTAALRSSANDSESTQKQTRGDFGLILFTHGVWGFSLRTGFGEILFLRAGFGGNARG